MVHIITRSAEWFGHGIYAFLIIGSTYAGIGLMILAVHGNIGVFIKGIDKSFIKEWSINLGAVALILGGMFFVIGLCIETGEYFHRPGLGILAIPLIFLSPFFFVDFFRKK